MAKNTESFRTRIKINVTWKCNFTNTYKKRKRERDAQRHKIKSTQHYFDTETVRSYSIRVCSRVLFFFICTLHCVVYYIHRSYIKRKRGTHRYIRHKYKKVKVHKVQSFYFYGNKRTGIRLFLYGIYEAMLYSTCNKSKSRTVWCFLTKPLSRTAFTGHMRRNLALSLRQVLAFWEGGVVRDILNVIRTIWNLS